MGNKTITQDSGLKPYEVSILMVATLTFQLRQWCELPPEAPMTKGTREEIKHLKNKCQKVIDRLNIRKLSELEEEFYQFGDQFNDMMNYFYTMKEEDATRALDLFYIVAALASNDTEQVKDVYVRLGNKLREEGVDL